MFLVNKTLNTMFDYYSQKTIQNGISTKSMDSHSIFLKTELFVSKHSERLAVFISL